MGLYDGFFNEDENTNNTVNTVSTSQPKKGGLYDDFFADEQVTQHTQPTQVTQKAPSKVNTVSNKGYTYPKGGMNNVKNMSQDEFKQNIDTLYDIPQTDIPHRGLYTNSDGILQGGITTNSDGKRTYEDRFADRKTGVGGFFSNLGADVSDTVKGLAQIMGGAKNFVIDRPLMNLLLGDKDKSIKDRLFTGEGIADIKNAWNTAPETLNNLKEGLKENYGQGNIDMWNVERMQEGKSPLNLDGVGLLQSFHAHPLNLLDLVGFGEVGKAKNIAKVTKGGQASKFGKTVGNNVLNPNYSENLVINGMQRLAETQPVQNVVNAIDSTPALRQITDVGADFLGLNPDSRFMGKNGAEVRQAKLIDQANQVKNIDERNKAIAQNVEDFGGLSDEEAKAFVKAIESGDNSIFEGNEKLSAMRDKFREKVNENANFYKEQGKLSEETITQLPINTYGSIKFKKPIDELTQAEKLEALKDIEKLPSEQKPFYMPIIYDNNLKASDFFANNSKNYKPNELKHRGVGMGKEVNSKGNKRIYDPVELANRLDAHRVKMVNTENMINELIDNFAQPYKVGDDLKEGYVAFNPDSFLTFYKKTIDLNETVVQKLHEMDNIDEAIKSAIEVALKSSDSNILEMVGAAKRTNIYQIPEEVAKTLQFGKGKKTIWGQMFDMGTAGFKRSVLGLSPKWFENNRIGNGIMAGLKGVDLTDVMKAVKLDENLLPDTLKSKSMYEAEKTIIGRTGGGDNGKFGNAMRLLGGEFIDTSDLKGIKKAGIVLANSLGVPMKVINTITDKMFAFNQYFEDLERKASYLHSVDTVGKKMLKTSGQNIVKQDELLKATLKDENVLNAVLKDVDNTLGDYINMTPFERRFIRRAVPFYSWLRTITRYTLSLTESNPIRANLTNKVSMLINDLNKEENEHLADYQKGSIPTNFEAQRTGKPIRLNYEHSIPFSTFADTEENPLGVFNPLITKPIEQLQGKRFFKGMPLQSRNYEKLWDKGYASLKEGELGKYVEDLPTLERILGIGVDTARTSIPALNWLERVGVGSIDNLINKGEFKPYDALYDTSFGGYNYEDGFSSKPRGWENNEALARLLLPMQAEAEEKSDIPVYKLKRNKK